MRDISKIFEHFKNLRLAVIGDIMLDRTMWGITSNRKNPEDKKGVKKTPIVQSTREEFYIGGAGNVASNIISLEANCDFYGIVGDDLYGRELKKMCEEKGIDIENLRVHEKYPTIVKARNFIDGEYNDRHDIGEKGENGESLLGNLELELEDEIIEKFRLKSGRYNGIVLSDYDKHIFSKRLTQEIIKISNERKLPIFADVKPINLDYFKWCTLICPNAEEASKMSGLNYSKENLNEMARKLQERIKSKYVVITCSEDGAYVYNNGDAVMVNTIAKKVEEVTGAGDTFISWLASSYSSGIDIYESVNIANCAAGIVVGKKGTSTLTQKEFIDKLKICV